MTEKNTELLHNYVNMTESWLKKLFCASNGYEYEMTKRLRDAMCYSLGAGGKRIRPALTLEFCRVCCGDAICALSSACAIEMLHTSSLIHDDLPAIDNDDYRRGRKACHREFDESTALFAGDALMALPFEIIADDITLDDMRRVRIMHVLAHATGADGMLGGQLIDKANESREADEKNLLLLYSQKTGALLSAACMMGCLAAGADNTLVEAAGRYGTKLGIAFQIIDDILDVTSTSEELGKPVGSDEEQNKNTFVRLFGLDKSREEARRYTDEALHELAAFKNNDFLIDLTEQLLSRRK